MIQDQPETDVEQVERRAGMLEDDGRLEQARDAYDAALRLNPQSQASAEGRARVALALHENGAADHCARALAFHGAHPDRQLRMIVTAASELGSSAIPLFEDHVRRNPASLEAHEMLAELRAEWGAGDSFADGYVAALREDPKNPALLMSYWKTLARAGRFDQALAALDANRSLFDSDRGFALFEADVANHAGLPERASAVLDQLDERPDALLARAQHRLQTGRADEAAKLLEAVAQAEPDNPTPWSLLELCWRMLGDPRHEWLIGQPGLYGTTELALSSAQLETIAVALRTLHAGRSQPIGQSVRGGTQTSGQLLLRTEPQITMLADALAEAIRGFVDRLPPADRRHPLLRHRNMGMAFGPSWSIRLTGGGHHAAHFHPNGVLSSACYIVLPDSVADRVEQPGWLELGRPPPALGLDLSPLATIEPKVGRLVLFPSFLFHGTRAFTGGERLTVAFDLASVPID